MICFCSFFGVQDWVKTMNLANRIFGFWIINITFLCCTNPLDCPVNIFLTTLLKNGLTQVHWSKVGIVFASTFWVSRRSLEKIWTKTSVYSFLAFSLCHNFILIWGRMMTALFRNGRCFGDFFVVLFFVLLFMVSIRNDVIKFIRLLVYYKLRTVFKIQATFQLVKAQKLVSVILKTALCIHQINNFRIIILKTSWNWVFLCIFTGV